MMGRTFWFVAGASAGLYTSIKARRLAYRLTPEGITDQLASLGLGARAFADEVRTGMAERESEIAHELSLPTVSAVDALDALDAVPTVDAVDVGREQGRAPRPVLDEADSTRPRALAATRS
jgi:Family of unknown function (DUF6167)